MRLVLFPCVHFLWLILQDMECLRVTTKCTCYLLNLQIPLLLPCSLVSLQSHHKMFQQAQWEHLSWENISQFLLSNLAHRKRTLSRSDWTITQLLQLLERDYPLLFLAILLQCNPTSDEQTNTKYQKQFTHNLFFWYHNIIRFLFSETIIEWPTLLVSIVLVSPEHKFINRVISEVFPTPVFPTTRTFILILRTLSSLLTKLSKSSLGLTQRPVL